MVGGARLPLRLKTDGCVQQGGACASHFPLVIIIPWTCCVHIERIST